MYLLVGLALWGCQAVSVPDATDVLTTESVVFELAPGIDASGAIAQWNFIGRNGRIPADVRRQGRRVVVRPATAVDYGLTHEVWLKGLRNEDGSAAEDRSIRFTTLTNPVVEEFQYAAGAAAGVGRRCEVDDALRITECVVYGPGLGEDGRPGTFDDAPIEIRTYEYDEAGRLITERVQEIVEGGYGYGDRRIEYSYDNPREYADTAVYFPGPDSDILLEGTISTFNDAGFRIGLWTYEGSPERIISGERYLVSDQGDELGQVVVVSPGPDREWGTEDDVDGFGLLIEADAAGRRVWESVVLPGDDLQVNTADDIPLSERRYGYDRRGAAVEYVEINQVGELDVTGRREYDGRRRVTRVMEIGGDPAQGATFDAPWLRFYGTTEYDDAGRRTRERRVVGPGPDGAWFSDDDTVLVERIFGGVAAP